MAINKKVVFSSHAKQRAFERLGIKEEYLSFIFEVKLLEIFKTARRLYDTDNGKPIYETVYDGKKVKFICSEAPHQILVNTVIVN